MSDGQLLEEHKIDELRSITGYDRMSCTKTLAQSDWDIDKAIKWFGITRLGRMEDSHFDKYITDFVVYK